jgi:hypothetical protein
MEVCLNAFADVQPFRLAFHAAIPNNLEAICCYYDYYDFGTVGKCGEYFHELA